MVSILLFYLIDYFLVSIHLAWLSTEWDNIIMKKYTVELKSNLLKCFSLIKQFIKPTNRSNKDYLIQLKSIFSSSLGIGWIKKLIF